MQFLGYRKRVIAADGDQSLDLCFFRVVNAVFQAIRLLRGIGARSAQDGAAAGQNSAHAGEIQRHGFVFHQAAPAFEKADKFVLVVKATFAHHGADHRVQPWAIAAAGEYANFHFLLLVIRDRIVIRGMCSVALLCPSLHTKNNRLPNMTRNYKDYH